MPEHYVVTLRIRGDASPAELQLKLVDESGANVWWWRRAGFAPSRDGQLLVLRRASLEFAWGPRSGGDPDRIGAVEIAVAADGGAAGTLWIDELRVEPREPATGPPRICAVRASSCLAAHEGERVLEPDTDTSWCAASRRPAPLARARLRRAARVGRPGSSTSPAMPRRRMRVLGSDDGAHWKLLARRGRRREARAAGSRTGEADARFVRLELARRRKPSRACEVVPIELAVSPARWASARARAAPRGRYPRHLLGEHAYWALVGGDGDERKGLLGEDGALEVDAEAFTLEPFLWTRRAPALAGPTSSSAPRSPTGSCPLPSVGWRAADLQLAITAFASGAPGRSALVARYAVDAPTPARPRDASPLPRRSARSRSRPRWQSLNLVGAVAPIERLARRGAPRARRRARSVVAASRARRLRRGDAPDEGLAALANGRAARRPARVDDPLGFAEGALAFDLRARAGGAARRS